MKEQRIPIPKCKNPNHDHTVCQIKHFIVCPDCQQEQPEGDHSTHVMVGFRPDSGLQIYCVKHKRQVITITPGLPMISLVDIMVPNGVVDDLISLLGGEIKI